MLKYLLIVLSLLSGAQALAGGDYCLSVQIRNHAEVTCPGNTELLDFRVNNPINMLMNFDAIHRVQAGTNVVVAERLYSEGYIPRGQFGKFGLFQRKVRSPLTQKNVILVKDTLVHTFIQEGGWALENHSQDPFIRDEFIGRVVDEQNLSLEEVISLRAVEVLIYKVND